MSGELLSFIYVIVLSVPMFFLLYALFRRNQKPRRTLSLPGGYRIDRELAEQIAAAPRGEPVLRRYRPEEYERDIVCVSCERGLLRNQFFWDIPLVDTSYSLQVCLSCNPGNESYVGGVA